SVRFTPAWPEQADSNAKGEDHMLTLRAPVGPVAAVRLEVLPDETYDGLVTRGKHSYFNMKITLAVQRAGEATPQPLPIAEAYGECATETYANGYTNVSVRDNWRSARHLARERQSAIYLLAQPTVLAETDRLVVSVTNAAAARVRVSVSPFGLRLPAEAMPAAVRAAFAASNPSPEQDTLLAAEYFRGNGSPVAGEFAAALRELHSIAECRGGRAFTMVTVAAEPRVTRVLARGNWQDEKGEIVSPEPPRFLTNGDDKARSRLREKRDASKASGATIPVLPSRAATDAPRQTRLDLAQWIASRENPLTARTFVNRLWKQFFGTGLSSTVDDLGMQGEYPSHPELLDWLAVEFIDRGWDVKAMVRLIVTSATYRQSSKNRPELRSSSPFTGPLQTTRASSPPSACRLCRHSSNSRNSPRGPPSTGCC
ncbi:MAG: DUF1553 domain-containing protein, partial [Opitutaceae bacterium]